MKLRVLGAVALVAGGFAAGRLDFSSPKTPGSDVADFASQPGDAKPLVVAVTNDAVRQQQRTAELNPVQPEAIVGQPVRPFNSGLSIGREARLMAHDICYQESTTRFEAVSAAWSEVSDRERDAIVKSVKGDSCSAYLLYVMSGRDHFTLEDLIQWRRAQPSSGNE